MGPEQFHKYMQYTFDTQFKTPEEKKMKKSMIKKINVAQKKKGLPVFKESDLGITTKKGKTIKAVHKTSGKEIVVVDTPSSRKKLKRMGLKVEGSNYEKLSQQKIKKWNKSAGGALKRETPMVLVRGRWYSWEEGDRKSVFVSDKNGKEYEFVYKDVEDIVESVNEAIEPNGIIAKINKIVQDKQAAKISGVLVDKFSASIMMQIYDKVNDKSKQQMNKGTMRQVQVILHKVMKHNKVRT